MPAVKTKSPKIRNCKFEFQCTKSWDELFETNVDSVRFCDHCEKNVYLTQSVLEAQQHAEKHECVAIPIELTEESRFALDSPPMVVGMMRPPPYTTKNMEGPYFRSVERVADYYGIDGCPAGWFFVGIDRDHNYQFGVLEEFADVNLFTNQARLILVDIPIGLISSGNPRRLCDVEARKRIQPRGSSVFPAPTRIALVKQSYREGSEANYLAVGRRLSVQTWAIVPKIREVDHFLQTENAHGKIREMHPEVAFWALNGQRPLKHGKKKAHGAEERLEVLSGTFPSAENCYQDALNTYKRKDVAADDILDAMVGAVTAMHFPKIKTLPESPIVDETGLPMEMVYADIS